MFRENISVQGESNSWLVAEFDSVQEFVEKRQGTCADIWNKSVEPYFRGKDGLTPQSWFGCGTREEFDIILKNGHKKYADMVREKQVNMAPPKSIKRKRIHGEYGDEVDIHMVNSGNLSTAWHRRSPKVRNKAKNIKILANIGQNCGISADQMQWIGVAALSVGEAFELAGYNVSIDAIGGSKNCTHEGSFAFIIPLKPYDMPIDIQGLSSVLCFPGFYRGPGFANFGLQKGTPSSGLGQTMGGDYIQQHLVPKYYTNPNEIIEMVSNSTLSQEACETEIKRLVLKYGDEPLAA